jgi:hypothetical protein
VVKLSVFQFEQVLSTLFSSELVSSQVPIISPDHERKRTRNIWVAAVQNFKGDRVIWYTGATGIWMVSPGSSEKAAPRKIATGHSATVSPKCDRAGALKITGLSSNSSADVKGGIHLGYKLMVVDDLPVTGEALAAVALQLQGDAGTRKRLTRETTISADDELFGCSLTILRSRLLTISSCCVP